MIHKKSYFINSAGKNIRKIGKEALQTFYVLTKDPYIKDKNGNVVEKFISDEDKNYFLNIDPKDITFDKLVMWFGHVTDATEGRRESLKNVQKQKYHPTDMLIIKKGEYTKVLPNNKIPEDGLKTTLGRLIFNKVLVERLGFESIIDYQNIVMFAGTYGKFDKHIADCLKDDKITPTQMRDYIDTRDWFGLQLHAVITTSFTPGVIKTPKSVKAMKKELIKQNRKALDNGDERVMEEIENKLIAKMKDELKDDIGMDLYNSGARGSVSNHLKNMYITRGASYNALTGKYDIIENSLLDGLSKKDIPTHSNTIVNGAYPKAVGTQVSGYLSKEILAAMQSEVLGEKDSDCGTTKYIPIYVTKDISDKIIDRYIIEGNKLTLLTIDNISKYIGKTVKLRSPMKCIRVGREKKLCNKCAGDFFYKVEKLNIGLACSRVAESTKTMNLQKFHENLVKTQQIDVDNMLL